MTGWKFHVWIPVFFESNSLVVYNQWGDKVYEAAPYSNDEALAWRGTLDGQPGKDLPDGVYFYIFKPGPNEATVKGFIEIFR
ncbi:MAG: gliding motility-associated C-terminal domain-containing protein [Lewinellaceae bacterium]|nr:gliding motility-associated C-terminal domain-containing protein [Lewinellaceae bacterium]